MSLLEGIEDLQKKLLGIKVRLHVLRAFVTDLEAVTKKKPFRIWDDLAWMMVLDSRDMLIVHLASFAMGLHKHHLKNVVLPHLKKLKRDHKPAPGDEDDPSVRTHAAAFDRLFPSCTKKTPSKQDLTDLCKRICERADRVRRDRNENRAHVFERGGNADMLPLEEVSELFEYLEEVLNDLRLLASDSTMATDSVLSMTDPRFTARVLVDHIVLRTDPYPERLDQRAGDYERLHEAHDEHPGGELFNVPDDQGLVDPADVARRPVVASRER
jgi:hypothetical protein